MNDPVILAAVRTPIGKFLGALKDISAPQLGSIAVRTAIERAAVDPTAIDEVILGNVVSAGLGQNPARQAALRAGLPAAVGALTINKVCGSGLKAVGLAAQAIMAGDASIIVAGGMESMSNAPHIVYGMREGRRLGNGTIQDAVIVDGLWEASENIHMGGTAEIIADQFKISRQRQDAYAVDSHRKAIEAIRAGRFHDEMVAVEVTGNRGTMTPVLADESPRADTTLQALSVLRPVFRENGSVTAGNAPGLNDGAAALVVSSAWRAVELGLKPLARIAGQAVSGVEPRMVMMAPIPAVHRLLDKIGWKLEDVDLVEINEAFAVQAIAVIERLGLAPDRVNVNGGAVALGHPLGASGARILVTLLHELRRRNLRRGIAALCLGGGNAVALAVEVL